MTQIKKLAFFEIMKENRF